MMNFFFFFGFENPKFKILESLNKIIYSINAKSKIKIITIKLSIDLIDFAYSNFLQRLLEDDAIFLKVLVKKKAVFLFTYFLTISQINKNCSFEVSDSSVFFLLFFSIPWRSLSRYRFVNVLRGIGSKDFRGSFFAKFSASC